VLCAVIVNASVLALLWCWQESDKKPLAARRTADSVEADAIEISLATRYALDDSEPAKSPEADLAVRTIESELTDLGASHAWAGEYFDCSEPGGGRELLIAPNAGFAMAYPREMGSEPTTFGTVRRIDGLLELVLAPGSIDAVDDRLPRPTVLVPIEWSGRKHLVEPRYWRRWSNFTKREWPAEYEPQNYDRGSFWLMRGGELGDYSGPSRPPAEYRKAWASGMHAHVTSWTAKSITPGSVIRLTSLELSAGVREGIAEGTRLFVDEMSDLDRPVRVNVAREHDSSAVLEQRSDDMREPHVGWTCSTLPKLE
jgi:hypothetical protein